MEEVLYQQLGYLPQLQTSLGIIDNNGFRAQLFTLLYCNANKVLAGKVKTLYTFCEKVLIETILFSLIIFVPSQQSPNLKWLSMQ